MSAGFGRRRLRDPQPAPQHEQEECPVHPVGDVGEEAADFLVTQLLGQRPSLAQEVARLDWGDGLGLAFQEEELVEAPQGIDPPVDGRRRQPLLVLPGEEAIDVAPGHLARRFWGVGEEEAQVQCVIADRMRRVVAPPQVFREEFDFLRQHTHLPAPRRAPCRCSICPIARSYSGPLGPLVELVVTQRHVERAVPHQLLEHLERHASARATAWRRHGADSGASSAPRPRPRPGSAT